MSKDNETIYLSEAIWGLEIAKKNGWHGFVDFQVPNNNEVETVVYHPSDIEAKIEYLKENYDNHGVSKTGDKKIVNSGAIYKFESHKRYILNRIAPIE